MDDYIDAEILGRLLNENRRDPLTWDTLMVLYRFDLGRLYADVCTGVIAKILPEARVLEVHGLINMEDVAQHRLASALESFTAACLSLPTESPADAAGVPE